MPHQTPNPLRSSSGGETLVDIEKPGGAKTDVEALAVSVQTPVAKAGATNLESKIDESTAEAMLHAEYTALAARFSTFVILSTFTATLIVAFIALAHEIIVQSTIPDPSEQTHFETGMFLGMTATVLHIGAIIVGGRAYTLCFRMGARSRAQSPGRLEANASENTSVNDVYRYVRYCEWLQFTASLTILAFFLYLAYFMFTHKEFFWALFGISSVGALSIISTGFWRVSTTFEVAKDFWCMLRRCSHC